MPTYFLYARKSTEESDRQVASIPAQLAELIAFATARGLVVSRVFEESQSARKPGRPVFADMMRTIERHPVAGVVCWKPDRLARNALDGGRIIDAIDRGRIGEIVTPGRMFKNTSDDKLMLNFEFGMSKKYVDDLSDNIRRGNRALVATGRCPGIVPLGYMKTPPEDRTHGRGAGATIRDPERFRTVQQLFRRFATGAYTLTEIASYARDKLRLRSRGTRRSPEGPVTLNTVYTMLRNPFYMGLLRHGGDVFPGAHEPMVTKDEFDKIQGLLCRHDNHRPKAHLFTYRSLVRCVCGRGTTAELHTKRSGLTFTYYRCTHRWKRSAPCGKPYVSEREIEVGIAATLHELAVPERFVRWALARLDAEATKRDKNVRDVHDHLRADLAARERELAKLTTLALRDLLSEDEFVETKTRLLAEKADIERRLEDPNAEATIDRQLRETIVVAADAARAFRAAKGDERRNLVASMCDALMISTAGLDVRLTRPFAILAGRAPGEHPAPKGANRVPGARNASNDGVNRASECRGSERPARHRCPAGANQPYATDSSLNQRESRALADARPMTFSRWWTLAGSNR